MGHNSVQIMMMTSKFELDLYFIMRYPSVNLENEFVACSDPNPTLNTRKTGPDNDYKSYC